MPPIEVIITDQYKYPSKIAQRIITKLFSMSIFQGQVGLQFKDETVFVGSGEYIATIAPPSLLRLLSILLKPDYRFASYYVCGYWSCEQTKLYKLLRTLYSQERSFLFSLYKLSSFNYYRDSVLYRIFPQKITDNIATHYNTSPDFMRLILGDSLVYTCAFFEDGCDNLIEAQQNKIDKIISRLNIQNDENVLDLGCGWGQVAEAVSRITGSKVTGVSISNEQISYAESVKSKRTKFIHSDYDLLPTSVVYDKIYSVGMLEHVGVGQLPKLFSAINRLLVPGGKALIHCIVSSKSASTNDWLDKEIFPGSHVYCLSEIVASVEASGFQISSIYCHKNINYFRTLKCWEHNFQTNYHKIKETLSADLSNEEKERIMRIWEMYLCGSQIAFEQRIGHWYNAHIILEKSAKPLYEFHDDIALQKVEYNE